MAPGFGGTSSTGSRNRAVVMGANVPVLLPKDSVHVHQATFVNSDDIPLENKVRGTYQTDRLTNTLT